MLIFLDESFRMHASRNTKFGVLAGIAIPEDIFHSVQTDVYGARRPYHDAVLKPEHELHGKELLGNATFKQMEMRGFSLQWNLVTELLQFCQRKKLKVFGVVCFRPELQSFVCGDENRLDLTYRYLFERIDLYMKHNFPGRFAKIVFDNRDHQTHKKNAAAITNFFSRSTLGLSYGNILRVPFFAVSEGHNYGLQIADIITTVIAMRFQGDRRIDPLWQIVRQMLYKAPHGGKTLSSLKVLRNRPVNELAPQQKEIRRPEGP